MNVCSNMQDRFVEALYDELEAVERAEFERHLSVCASCAAAYESCKKTLLVMDLKEQPDPGEDFWAGFHQRLDAGIARQGRSSGMGRILRLPVGGRLHRPAPHWALRTAAALALVAIGIVIGRTFVERPAHEPPLTASNRDASMADAAEGQPELYRRVSDYVSRSQTLLLGIVNFDTQADGADAIDLQPQRRVSHDLMREADWIQTELSKGDADRQLVELIQDLQTILVLIANIEAKQDLEAVDIVRDSVDSSNLLLKINLQNIRLADRRDTPSESPKDRRRRRSL